MSMMKQGPDERCKNLDGTQVAAIQRTSRCPGTSRDGTAQPQHRPCCQAMLLPFDVCALRAMQPKLEELQKRRPPCAVGPTQP